MSHVSYFEQTKRLEAEHVVVSLDGWTGDAMGKGDRTQHNGSLVITNERVAFIRKGFFGEVFEAIPISKITSVEARSFMGYRVATFHTSHDQLSFKTFAGKSEFAEAISLVELRQKGRAVRPAEQTQSGNFVHELKSLSTLRETGALSVQEFNLAKAHLLKTGSLHTGNRVDEPIAEVRAPMVGRSVPKAPPLKDKKSGFPIKGLVIFTAMVWAFGIGLSWMPEPAESTSSAATALPSSTRKVSLASTNRDSCDEAAALASEVVGVKESYEIRLSPNENGERIRNAKASANFGKTHYHVVDTSTTVRQLCASNTWSKVQIVEPQWLDFVTGWMPTRLLRTINKTADGVRLFVEADFYWDEYTLPYKDQLIKNVNKIAREHDGCEKLDPFSTSLSGSKSKPGDPVFYVTCMPASGLPFNVWFKPDA